MDVKHVAALASLHVTVSEEKEFAEQFADTLLTVNVINQLDTARIPATFQVTGLKNVTREDKVDHSRILSQSEAVSQASSTHHGYIVVPAIFDDQ